MYWYREELEKFYDKIKEKFKILLNIENIEDIDIYSVKQLNEINERDKQSYERSCKEEIEKYERNSMLDEDDDEDDEEYEDYDYDWDEPYDINNNPFDKKLIEFFQNNKCLYIYHKGEIFYYNFRKFERYKC